LPPVFVMPASTSHQAAQVGASADALTQCPLCGRTFPRKQERDRHVGTYLPYCLFCPSDRCCWRGDRAYDLKTHWLTTHADLGKCPQPDDCRIYNPDPLVQSLISGNSTIGQVREIALQAVRIRAPELDKVGVWDDEWGRRQRIPN
jgi:hypothetical protein